MSYFVEAHKNKYKSTFGATFHKHMSVHDILNVWDTKVPQEVKDCFPELNAAFEALRTALQLIATAYHLYLTAKMLYEQLKKAIMLASAILTGQVAFPTAELEQIATALALEAERQAIRAAREQLLPIILDAATAGRCPH